MNHEIVIAIQEAQKKDIPQLFEMNKQLMTDEQYDRPLSDDKLKDRWDEFMSKDRFKVILFLKEDETIVGYAIIHMDDTPYYLRHFYIKKEFRKQKIGTSAFRTMLAYLDAEEMDLDVMSWNHGGIGFWQSLGFVERCKAMTLKK